jgi:sugar O-acyltransferase (sialic acid O-acetyltransferase NeuD family)
VRSAAILGYSGHSYVLIELLNSIGKEIVGYYDSAEKKMNPYNLPYLGSEQDKELLLTIGKYDVYIGIGNNAVRERIYTLLEKNNVNQPYAAHANSILSKSATILSGSVIMQGAIISAQVSLGKSVIINSGAIVEHECRIGDFSHIAPGAVLAGNVSIGVGSFIGANSVIKEGIKIGDNVTVGAGSVVIKDIASNTINVGNPSREIKKNI